MIHHATLTQHPLPGPTRGIPDVLAAQNNRTARVSVVPTTEEACELFEAAGGHLYRMMPFGVDPLAQYPLLINERQRVMEGRCPPPDQLFACTVNEDYTPFAQALQCMIDTTMDLQRFT